MGIVSRSRTPVNISKASQIQLHSEQTDLQQSKKVSSPLISKKGADEEFLHIVHFRLGVWGLGIVNSYTKQKATSKTRLTGYYKNT